MRDDDDEEEDELEYRSKKRYFKKVFFIFKSSLNNFYLFSFLFTKEEQEVEDSPNEEGIDDIVVPYQQLLEELGSQSLDANKKETKNKTNTNKNKKEAKNITQITESQSDDESEDSQDNEDDDEQGEESQEDGIKEIEANFSTYNLEVLCKDNNEDEGTLMSGNC